MYFLLKARVERYCDEILPLKKTMPLAVLLSTKRPQLQP